MKKHEEIPEETEEQKRERWEKAQKKARSFARQCGVDLKKISKERRKIAMEHARGSEKYDY